MKITWTFVAKIAFCAVLIVVLVGACFGVRLGRRSLRAELTDVRNADILDRLCADFEGNAGLLDGFSVSKENFRSAIISHASNYYGQKLCVAAQNRTKRDVTVLGLEVRAADEDAYGIYLSRTPLTAVTIPAGTDEPQNIWFYIVDDRDNEDALDVLSSAYALKILYVDASTGVTRLSDASADQLFAERIRATGASAYQTKPHLSSTVIPR